MDIKLNTLQYLIGDHNIKSQIKNKDKEKKKLLKEEKKFYRKRILSVTKDLFKKENINKENEFIQNAFNSYVNCLIEHFKKKDLTEIMQEEYNDLDFEIEENNNEDTGNFDLVQYDIKNNTKKNITIDSCLNLNKKKETTSEIYPIEKHYDLKTKKNKKKRNI